MKNNIDFDIEANDNVQKLSDVFNEINGIRRKQNSYNYNERNLENIEETNFFFQAEQKIKSRLKKFIVADIIVMVTISFSVFANYIFAFTQDDVYEDDVKAVAAVEFEANSSAIDLTNVLLENVSVLKTKELIEEAVDIEFETKYIDDENMPLGEEKVEQEGVLGSKDVTVIKTYENDDLVEENLIEEEVKLQPKEKVIRKGTSEFLKKNSIVLGATIYVTEDVALKEKNSTTSADLDTIPSSIEVVLKQMSGDWCKVSYKGKEGYVLSSKLTSATATPTILNANRIKKIQLAASEDMALNKSSGLTLEDFKRILSNNPRDKYGIFADAAEDFYKADVNYNVNGILLASIGIHESAWGTSKIARDKKNLFGYGAYDWSPYESAYSFDTYYEGIEILAKSLSKNYINTPGTVLSNGEIATGAYYNGNTVEAINVRYASDPDWHSKVWKYMNELYNSL